MAMPRSLWNGTIAFGLVRVPIKLHSATESKRIAFKERHAADGAAIEHRRVCVKEGREVPYHEIVRGFEVSSGSYVVLSKDELAVAEGAQARAIEIEHFVAEQEIDPIYYERAYYLSPGVSLSSGATPGEQDVLSYRVLHAALSGSARVGIGRFVFHNKEHLVAVRPLQAVLAMQTMRFADEIVPDSQIEPPSARRQATRIELDTARLLIDQLADEFDPAVYEDAYREQLLALIERKARGEAIEPPAPPPVTQEADLLDVLKQSVERQGARRRRVSADGAGAREASGREVSAGGKGGRGTRDRGAGGRGSAVKRSGAKRGGS